VLYVDEVNLLHDHLVDLLLDAAALGTAYVEREGVSVRHAARFLLVGTMNPEEGELRPQLLDRFGLTVEVSAPREPALRVDVVRRRMAYDNDPDAFAAAYAGPEKLLTERILAAQSLVGHVHLSDEALLKIAEVCAAFEVDGMRADIVTARAALAHAAWHDRDEVTRADIRAAARLALPHRRRRNPFDAPGLDEDLLDQILGDDEPDPTDPPEPPPGDDDGDQPIDDTADTDPGSADDDTDDDASSESAPQGHDPDDASPEPPAQPPGGQQGSDQTTTVGASDPYRTRLFTVRGTGSGAAGKRHASPRSTGAYAAPVPN